jgi:AraC-like DNA-binding protein
MLELMHHTINQKVADFFDLYTQMHDIRISLFGPEGKLIYPDSVGRPNCQHCRMLRDNLRMDPMCRELDHKMMKAAFERQDMITYTCHAGMREATAPILVNDELVGYVMLGQFRSEAAPEQSPYAERWEAEKGNSDLQKAYEETTVFPEAKIETLLSMFRHLMEFMVGGQLIHHKDYDLIQPVIDRIQDHPDQELLLEEAAKLVGRSPSTVSRIFKKVTGRSFKQYQVNYRLEKAAARLLAKPNCPVAEIAMEVGYDDPLYFSRVFKKQYKCSPSEYRSR